MSWFTDAIDIVTQQRDVETFSDGVVFVVGFAVLFGLLALAVECHRRLKGK